MKIRYKISTLMILLTVVIILLINFSYVRIVTWATDDFITRYLPPQITSAFLDVPSADEIDWDEMQVQIDRAVEELDDLLYIAIYSADTNEPLIGKNTDRIQSLLGGEKDQESLQNIMDGLRKGEDVDIRDARRVELLPQSDSEAASLRIVIGYIFPILDEMRSFIIGIALILILIFTIVAIIGSFFLAGGITKPIRKLVSAMQEASEGNLNIAVRVRSRDEVGQLAKVFNKMMYQLSEKTSELEHFAHTLEERVEREVAERRRRDEAEKQRLIREIQHAREVQMGLFPKSPPQIEGLDIWGVCHPAMEVGGDFFDYLPLDENKSCIALGDVSGKGMRGAMNAVMAYGMLHAQARSFSSAATIISELNAALFTRMEETTFTTLSLGIIDVQAREIQLCNAGNPYPVLLREGKASLLELSGMPLGIIPEIDYDEERLALIPGDVLVLYSDGISEAMTADDRMYGMDTLRKLIGTFPPGLSAQSVVERILQDVRRFVGDYPQSDDMTIIAARVYEVD